MRVYWLLFVLLSIAGAQDVLTNDSIVKMTKAGLGEGIVVTTIQNQPGKYSLGPDDLIKLKQQGVSDKAIAAMIAKGTGGSATPSVAAPGAVTGESSDTDIPKGADVGVYFRKGEKWEEMLPEVVNWKTGGVLKHIASAGVVKGDVNGHIPSTHSRNSTKTPVEVIIYTPEGVAVTEYQLIHLHEEQDSREFRTVTGGVFHESGGAMRDVIPFESKKVASRMYKVLLPNLGAGEYGFLPPGAVTSSSSASIGKMYTFRLIE
ncbi:MAG: hypothetical protein JO336_18495 [Acidobacteriia bacterium]|nr:hypothetical protein [Terriglobia bacterium]MBV8906398.1 hypothetical protein [Terriglobia bacterium]MBV9746255.1 hypothetical protein [Terriglobia bacterium]